MTRKETAIKKFESSLTDKQRDIIKAEIAKEMFYKAETIMGERHKARLYPSINFDMNASGLASLMFNYGLHSQQLWGRDAEDKKWIMYQYKS
jgi:hypothetical protein